MGTKGKKRNHRMWSGIKPGDANFTPIPTNIGLSEGRRKWDELSFWQKAEGSEYFEREGKERWLRDCVLLNSEEDFRIAYEIGPPDFYTDESLHKFDVRERNVTLDSLAKMHPDISFPEPLQNLPPEPLEPFFGQVMLKDLRFEQLLMYVQTGAYFYPDTPTDEINEMVQQFKREQKAKCQRWKSMASDEGEQRDDGQNATVPTVDEPQKGQPKEAEKKPTDEMASPNALTPSIFGGILRQNSAQTRPKKNVRWANLKTMSDGSEVQMAGSDDRTMMGESVRLAMDAPLDDDGWEDF